MNTKYFMLGALATALVGGGGYYLGTQKSITPPTHLTETNNGNNYHSNSATGLPNSVTNETHSDDSNSVVTESAADTGFEHFRVGNKNVKSMLSDGPIMWVGTSGGVIRYNTHDDSHKVYDTSSGLLANGIFHLSKFKGQLVAGTYGGGLSILDETTSKWKTYNVPEGLADAFVYDMLELDNGDLWIATWSGANVVRQGKLDDLSSWDTHTVKNTNGGLPNDWVYALRKGKNGEIWMATEGGLARFHDNTWTNWSHADGLGAPYQMVKDQIIFKNDPAKVSSHHARQKQEMGLQDVDIAYNPNYIISLFVGDDGVVWAGTWGGGLARFKDNKWQNFTLSDCLPSNHISLIDSAGNGQIWVGTTSGLALFDGTQFKVFTVQDGLFANGIFSLAEDAQQNLWVGSYGGVAKIHNLNP